MRDNVWCQADGVGERVPVKLVEGEQRAALLKAFGRDKEAEKTPLRFVTLQCNRTLTPGGRVQLVYGKGVATPSGVVNNVERRFDFQVREPFAVSFSCERENAQSRLPAAAADGAAVQCAGGAQAGGADHAQGRRQDASSPKFDDENAARRCGGRLGELRAALRRTDAVHASSCPPKFEDASGRALASPDSFPLKVATGAMPPLAKFAASPFGVVERLAEPGGTALMPVTVRRVEPALQVQALTPGKVSDMNPKTDAEIIAWFRKVRRYDSNYTIVAQARRAAT